MFESVSLGYVLQATCDRCGVSQQAPVGASSIEAMFWMGEWLLSEGWEGDTRTHYCSKCKVSALKCFRCERRSSKDRKGWFLFNRGGQLFSYCPSHWEYHREDIPLTASNVTRDRWLPVKGPYSNPIKESV